MTVDETLDAIYNASMELKTDAKILVNVEDLNKLRIVYKDNLRLIKSLTEKIEEVKENNYNLQYLLNTTKSRLIIAEACDRYSELDSYKGA